jgi:hypothetical protein
MKFNKYSYYLVIQTNSGYGFDDDDIHQTNSTYWPKDNKAFKDNLKAYKANFPGPIRVIRRRELNQV